MDKCGRGGGRYSIRDAEALAALWGELTTLAARQHRIDRPSLHGVAQWLGIDYATAYGQARPSYHRRRQQMRPATAWALLEGMASFSRGPQTAERRATAARLRGLWEAAVERGWYTRQDHRTPPAAPPLITEPRRWCLSGLPVEPGRGGRPGRRRLAWWVGSPSELASLATDLKERERDRYEPELAVYGEVLFLAPRLGALLVGPWPRLSAADRELYAWARLIALNTREELVDPDPRTRGRTLTLWDALGERLDTTAETPVR